ncbi:unnamed protein product [Phyllotreta striolata]|uniref:Large ribosomal subunit protein mL37 n=1 Tax=Phyllotreta striolata TaxID=444603 RepID=A0A9N9TK51_PHYSR|nr:unnamed protein product [Phyllotreta striolata]
MRITPVLLKQHLGWHFYKHWVVQGKVKPLETGATAILKSKGIPVYDPKDIISEKRTIEKIQVIGERDLPQPLDETHPNWHETPLFKVGNNNVLLEGLNQAQIVTNSVKIADDLPNKINVEALPKSVDKVMKSIIMQSHVFDAEQKTLPKIKDPERPAWNFPRIYGISQERRNKIITHKLINLLENTSDKDLAKQRYIFEDLLFSYPFERNGQLAQLEVSGNVVMTSTKPLPPITNDSLESHNLPNIDPIDPLITFTKEHIYELRNIYPIKSTVKAHHPHTIFIHFDREFVKNLYEEEVTTEQIFGRSLLHTFTVAASYARQKYGDGKTLDEPVTVQCVQTDGRIFHFGVLQLNTLNLLDASTKNVWYQTPLQYLFENCEYVKGKPVLEGYNNQIIQQLHSFYRNV